MVRVEKAKVKNDQPSKEGKRYWKYISPILFILTVYILVHLSLVIYSRLFGEWASMTILEAPPVGELILDTTVQDMGYFNKNMLYRIDMDLHSAHKLFDDEYVTMLPIGDTLSPQDTSYRSGMIIPNSLEYNFLLLAGCLTTETGCGRFDIVPSCFFVELYRPDAFVKTSFYQEYLSDEFDVSMREYTIARVNRCYPDWY